MLHPIVLLSVIAPMPYHGHVLVLNEPEQTEVVVAVRKSCVHSYPIPHYYHFAFALPGPYCLDSPIHLVKTRYLQPIGSYRGYDTSPLITVFEQSVKDLMLHPRLGVKRSVEQHWKIQSLLDDLGSVPIFEVIGHSISKTDICGIWFITPPLSTL